MESAVYSAEGDALLNDSTVSAEDEFFDAREASFLDGSSFEDEREQPETSRTNSSHLEQQRPQALVLPGASSPEAKATQHPAEGIQSAVTRNTPGKVPKYVELATKTPVPIVTARQHQQPTEPNAAMPTKSRRPATTPDARTAPSTSKPAMPSLLSTAGSWATRACALGSADGIGGNCGWHLFGSTTGSEETDSPATSRAGSAFGGWGSSITTGYASSGRPLSKQYSFRSSSRNLRATSTESPGGVPPVPLQPQSQPQKVYSDSGEPLTWAQVIYAWQRDDDFCEAFTDALQGLPFRDFFWETVPVSPRTMGEQTFEFVVIDAHGTLDANSGNPRLFLHSTFQGQDSNSVEAFYSSSQRVMIVTPCQNGRADDYSHLASFLRRAPPAQVRELWRKLGQSVETHLSTTTEANDGGTTACAKRGKPLWVSSNGVGVPWLHIRLDTAPKYYNHTLWKIAPEKLRSMGVSPVSTEASSRQQQSPFLSGNSQLKHRPLARISQHHAEGSEGGAGAGSPQRMLELGEEGGCGGGSSVQEGDVSVIVSQDDSRSISSLTDDLYACSEGSGSFFRGCFSSCGLLRRRRFPCFRRTNKSRYKKAASKDHMGAYTPCPHMAARRKDLLALAH